VIEKQIVEIERGFNKNILTPRVEKMEEIEVTWVYLG